MKGTFVFPILDYVSDTKMRKKSWRKFARIDVIYSGSEFTIIIAAAEQDPSFGVPGVSRVSQKF